MNKNNRKQALRNLPLIALNVTVSLALEAIGWGYIFLTNHEHSTVLGVSVPLALVEATIISATGLLALIASFVAAERKNDPRPEQRRKAFGAQILAVALIVPPVMKAADSFAFPAQTEAAETFASSQEAEALRGIIADPLADSPTKRDAAAELGRATSPTRARLDMTWIAALMGAAFLYGVNMMAASLLWRAKPETPAERERRIKAEDRYERRRKAAQEHEFKLAELAVQAAANRPSFIKAIFKGGRKAA